MGKFTGSEKLGCAAVSLWILSIGAMLAAWITHIVICIQSQQWILLIAGAIAAPIGIVHGIGHWFGVW